MDVWPYQLSLLERLFSFLNERNLIHIGRIGQLFGWAPLTPWLMVPNILVLPFGWARWAHLTKSIVALGAIMFQFWLNQHWCHQGRRKSFSCFNLVRPIQPFSKVDWCSSWCNNFSCLAERMANLVRQFHGCQCCQELKLLTPFGHEANLPKLEKVPKINCRNRKKIFCFICNWQLC